jgi:hypothetical protein
MGLLRDDTVPLVAAILGADWERLGWKRAINCERKVLVAIYMHYFILVIVRKFKTCL